MNYLCLLMEHSNFAVDKISELIPVINELSISIYISMPRMKTNLIRGDFG